MISLALILAGYALGYAGALLDCWPLIAVASVCVGTGLGRFVCGQLERNDRARAIREAGR